MIQIQVPDFSKQLSDAGSLSDWNPGEAAIRGINRRRLGVSDRFAPTRFDPSKYIVETLGWRPWSGTADGPGQQQIIEAYQLALRQQHEKAAFEAGEIAENELEHWKPGQIIQNWIRIEAGHTVGKCVVSSDMITLADGSRVPAGELIGKSFDLLTLAEGKAVAVGARAEFNAVEAVYEIVTDAGKRVTRNAQHPFFVAKGVFVNGRRPAISPVGFTSLINIQPGDLIAVAEELPAFGEEASLTEVEIKLLAYLLGDGGYTRSLISFSQQDNPQLAEFRACAEVYGCKLTKISAYDWMITGKNGRSKDRNNPILNLLRAQGMARTHSRDKRIPDAVFQLPRPVLQVFLSRLFATDGWASIDKNNIREIGYCSASRQLVEEVAHLLQKLGIHCRVTKRTKVNAWQLYIRDAGDQLAFAERVGIYGKEAAVEAVAAEARRITERRARNERPDRPRWWHKGAPVGTRWERVKSITVLPESQATVAIEVPEHHTFLTAFWEHNTKLASGLVNHFFDHFDPSIIYTYAPTWEQVKDLLWKEISADRRGRGLPGRVLETCEIRESPNHFAKGRATNNAGGQGTERAQGQHERYLMFVFDEAEGIPEFVYDAVNSMTSGGISIVLLLANPRTRSSRVHKVGSNANVKNFRISCLHHPNVIAGREIVPGAVKRDYVIKMLVEHCRVVSDHDPDAFTFEVPWEPGVIYEPDPEFMFRVLGIAPANIADKNLIPVGRFEAAVKRKPAEDRPTVARLGLDVARFGADVGTLYVRWNGRVWRAARLARLDSIEYYQIVKRVALELRPRGVTSLHIRVDGGGGFGGGVVDNLKRDSELMKAFPDFKVFELHFGGGARDQAAYFDAITEWTADVAESLKGIAIQSAPNELQDDLCGREYDWRNKEGRAVKKLEEKALYRKRKKRSPDDGDGFVLAVVSDHLVTPAVVKSAVGGVRSQLTSYQPR